MKKVNVLMSTYNGEAYIREQLDSLYHQTYQNIDVYIRDDGSTDGTYSIVEEYSQKSNDKIRFIVIPSNDKNLGYPDCFWELLRVVPKADYYSFCDQDDWWYPRKIEEAVLTLNTIDESIPALTFCKFDYYDSNMKFIRNGDFYANQPTFAEGLYYTYAPGFTQVMNRALIEKINYKYNMGKKLAHDIWCQWIASSMGVVIQQDEILAKYRRHESAVTSANQGMMTSINYWFNKEIKGDEMKKWKQSLLYFSKCYYPCLPLAKKKQIDIFAGDNGSSTLKKMFYRGKLRPTKGGDLALRILFLLRIC